MALAHKVGSKVEQAIGAKRDSKSAGYLRRHGVVLREDSGRESKVVDFAKP